MLSTKSYLVRAIYDWAEDNGFTPQVLVNAEAPNVEVPTEHVVDGQIILNISSSAVAMLTINHECISCSARFGGVEKSIMLPMDSVEGIYARENSQGLYFERNDSPPEAPKQQADLQQRDTPKKAKESSKTKPKKSSHLKIIK